MNKLWLFTILVLFVSPAFVTGAGKLSQPVKVQYRQSVQMNEPMTTNMAKPGMMKGEVRENAIRRETVMQQKMQTEQMKQ